MDLEVGVLDGAVASVAVVEDLMLMGVTKEDFDVLANGRVFAFLCEHAEKHEMVPSRGAVKDLFGVDLCEQGVATDFLYDEFLKRKLFRLTQTALGETSNKLRGNDPVGAVDALRKFLDSDDAAMGGMSAPANLLAMGDQVMEMYDRVKNGYMGIQMPWDGLTDLTMGMWPKTVTWFVARPGVGKTMAAMLIALHAWTMKKRVLIVSPEMSKTEMAERFFVLKSRVSAMNLMRGTLPEFEYRRLVEEVEKSKTLDGIGILDSDDQLTGHGIESAVRTFHPDLLIIDSIYMMQFKGDKTERLVAAVDWLRTAVKKMGIPAVGFHQLSRQATKAKKFGGGADENAIALSDQLLWDAHAIFVMIQDMDMKMDRKMKFHVGKIRRGSWDGRQIECNWDFDTMDFSEVEREEEERKKDDGDDFPF